MDFKKLVLATLGSMSLFLGACTGSTSPADTSSTSQQSGASQPAQSDSLLDGVVTAGKFRVDLMSDDFGARFNYGNEAVVSKKEMTFNANSTLAMSGTATVDLNFVFVSETAAGFSVAVNKEIDKEQISEFLSDRSFKDATRVYVAISKGEVDWTKGLNEKMDAKIKTFLK